MVKKGLSKKIIIVGGLFFLAVLAGFIIYLNTKFVVEGLVDGPAPSVIAATPSAVVPPPVITVPPPVTNSPSAQQPQPVQSCQTGEQNVDGQCVKTSSMLKSSAKLLLHYLDEQN